jgi:hypothetical protein
VAAKVAEVVIAGVVVRGVVVSVAGTVVVGVAGTVVGTVVVGVTGAVASTTKAWTPAPSLYNPPALQLPAEEHEIEITWA